MCGLLDKADTKTIACQYIKSTTFGRAIPFWAPLTARTKKTSFMYKCARMCVAAIKGVRPYVYKTIFGCVQYTHTHTSQELTINFRIYCCGLCTEKTINVRWHKNGGHFYLILNRIRWWGYMARKAYRIYA